MDREAVHAQTASTSTNTTLICAEFSEIGSMVIPAAALSALPVGTVLELYTIGRAPLTAGDFSLMVVAAGSVVSPDKTRSIALMLE